MFNRIIHLVLMENVDKIGQHFRCNLAAVFEAAMEN